MAKTTVIKFLSIATILLAVAVFSLMPAKSTYAQGGGVLQQSAATGTAFTYQGSLVKSGSGVTDSCNFNFALYDALSAGGQVGSTVVKNGVSVSNGIFTVDLDFGGTAFDGNARYLDIQVQCTGDASAQQLSPRTALNAAPYALTALGLKSGVNVSGNEAGRVFGAQNTDTTGTGVGLYGDTQSNNGAGVSGINLSTNTGGVGVYGGSNNGTGVYGTNNNADTGSAGVVGSSQNSNGTGVRGETVNGKAIEGVVDWTQSGTGIGIYGSGAFYGNAALFENMASITPTVMIENAAGSTAPALVVTGTTQLDTVTWKPVTSYLSIPPAAFHPLNNSNSYDTYTWYIAPGSTGTPESYFIAPVYLPHGATITKVTWHWYDVSVSNGSAFLYRKKAHSSSDILSQLSTSGNGGYASSTDLTIDFATVDNSQYTYFIWLGLPDANIWGEEVFIEYSITQPY